MEQGRTHQINRCNSILLFLCSLLNWHASRPLHCVHQQPTPFSNLKSVPCPIESGCWGIASLIYWHSAPGIEVKAWKTTLIHPGGICWIATITSLDLPEFASLNLLRCRTSMMPCSVLGFTIAFFLPWAIFFLFPLFLQNSTSQFSPTAQSAWPRFDYHNLDFQLLLHCFAPIAGISFCNFYLAQQISCPLTTIN